MGTKIDNKGFTLVELIAVMVILVSIALVAVGGITSSLEKREIKECKEQKELAISAAKIYFSLNDATSVSIGELNSSDSSKVDYFKNDNKIDKLSSDDEIILKNGKYVYKSSEESCVLSEAIMVTFDVNGGDLAILYTSAKESVYTVPATATYKLEVWGAQGGGTSTYYGGYGGYSVGKVNLEEGNTLYVNVGGQGASRLMLSDSVVIASGGYNGGGKGYSTGGTGGAGGGGATHIATTSGTLSSLSSNISAILIVAGGGGGYGSVGGSGGNAGGRSGLGYNPGTQTSGGGAFGIGADFSSTYSNRSVGGGGGGYYGGGSGYYDNVTGRSSPSGGGSGYIGNVLLMNKAMYCYECTKSNELRTLTYSTTNVSEIPTAYYAKMGNGAVKITRLGIENKVVSIGSTYGELPTPSRYNYVFKSWNTKADGSGETITSDSVVNLDSNQTLYAIWK